MQKPEPVKENATHKILWDFNTSYDIVNHIISECSKLIQKKKKIWYDCMGKMIY